MITTHWGWKPNLFHSGEGIIVIVLGEESGEEPEEHDVNHYMSI